MVAGDHHHGHPFAADEAVEGGVEESDRVVGRHRAVVDVAGDDDRVGPDLAHELDEAVEDVGLVVGEMDAVEEAPEVPVGCVQDPHARLGL